MLIGLAFSFNSMLELSSRQMQAMERLFAAGFRPIVIPPYESAVCMKKGACAAVLAPVPNGGLRVLAPPSYLVDGRLGVRLKRGTHEVFVWKSREVEATPERVRELEAFQSELSKLLQAPLNQ